MSNEDKISKPLKEWIEDFYEDTGTVSDLVRNLSFAGIALIWIFNKASDNTGEVLLPIKLILPLILLSCALIFDVLQYLIRGILINKETTKIEAKYDANKLSENDISDVVLPTYIRKTGWFFFGLKVTSVLTSYGFIIYYLITILKGY